MPARFGPDGDVVEVDGVRITSRGLSGVAEVHLYGSASMRAAEASTEEFRRALDAAGFVENLTVEISEGLEHPESMPGGTRGSDSEAGLVLDVPGPGSGNGQMVLDCSEDGRVEWHFPEVGDGTAGEHRGEDRRTYRLPAHTGPAAAGGHRGILGAIGKRLIKVVGFALIDPILGAVGGFFAKRWEAKHRPHRLRGFGPADYRSPSGDSLGSEALRALAAGPALLFVHGTMSTAHGAFCRIPEPAMQRLFDRYGGRVFAFEHPTVSVTPSENVRWLAKALPANAGLQVDIVSHSRGGLVGRAMVEQAGACGLVPLQLTVRSLVMVGTPNAGTALADHRHLRTFLDTYTNMLEFLPDNPVTDTLEVVLAVLKQVATAVLSGLEGIQSMNPSGDYLSRELNRMSPLSPRYHALAANYEPSPGEPLGRFARDRLTDKVFGGVANDLVVPTAGVYEANGSACFPITDAVVFEASEGVDHGGFWTRPKTLEAFDRWLVGSGSVT